MKHGFYKELYLFEFTRWDQLTSTLSIPIGILTVVGGGMVYLVRSFPFLSDGAPGSILNSFPEALFSVFMLIALVSYIISVFFLFRAYHGFTYQRIPTAIELRNHYAQLLKHNRAYHAQYQEYLKALEEHEEESDSEHQPEPPQDDTPEAGADRDFEDFLNERFAEATEINARNNRLKASHLHRARGAIIVVLVFVAAATLLYTDNVRKAPSPVYRIELVNPGRISLEEDLEDGHTTGQVPGKKQDSSQTPKPPPKPPQKPPPPSGPENVDIKEGGGVKGKK